MLISSIVLPAEDVKHLDGPPTGRTIEKIDLFYGAIARKPVTSGVSTMVAAAAACFTMITIVYRVQYRIILSLYKNRIRYSSDSLAFH